MDSSPNDGKLEPYQVEALKLLRSKDPNSLDVMYERYYAAVKESWADGKLKNAVFAGELPTPIELLTYYAQESSSVSIAFHLYERKKHRHALFDSRQANVNEAGCSGSTSVAESLPPLITMEQAQRDPVIAIQSDSDGESDNSVECCVCG